MRKNRQDNKAKYLLILLLLIAVGYAAIATTLKINGSADVKSARWNVYWENPQVLSGSVTNTAPTLSESDTKATFNVTLNEPGDYYEFTIDAVNNGSLDAKIDTNGIVQQVKNSSGEVVNPTILKYEVTNNDQEHTAIQEGHILAKKSGNTPTKETYRVRVEYRNDEGINPSDLDDNDLVFTIEFSVKYVQGPKAEPVDPYSMASMCPGCVFARHESEQFINQPLSVETTDNYDSYTTRFLGYVVENNVVTRAFVCSKSEYGTFCLEGTDGISKYQRNKDILDHFFSNCEEGIDENENFDTYKCYINSSNNVFAYIDEGGNSNIFRANNNYCVVGRDFDDDTGHYYGNVFSSCTY